MIAAPFTAAAAPLRRTVRSMRLIARDAADPSDRRRLAPGPPREAHRARGACGHDHRRNRAARPPGHSRRLVAAAATRECSEGGRSHGRCERAATAGPRLPVPSCVLAACSPRDATALGLWASTGYLIQ